MLLKVAISTDREPFERYPLYVVRFRAARSQDAIEQVDVVGTFDPKVVQGSKPIRTTRSVDAEVVKINPPIIIRILT